MSFPRKETYVLHDSLCKQHIGLELCLLITNRHAAVLDVFRNIPLVENPAKPLNGLRIPKARFLVVCDPSMNKL